MLYIAVDGTGVPMVAAETEGRRREGATTAGPAPARSSWPACSPRPAVDEDGSPVRDPGSSTYLATFEPAARFGQLVDAEARRRGAEHIRQLVVLGDGAALDLEPRRPALPRRHPDRRPLPRPRAPARPGQPGRPAARAATRRLARRRGWPNSTPATSPRCWPPAATSNFTGSLARERDKALGYFETNAHRMRYQHFRSLGMFVGSGVVEAGCKAVIGQRLKLSGMRWTVARRHRHRHPALPGSQRPLGTDLAAAPQPDQPPPDPASASSGTLRPPQADLGYLQNWRAPASDAGRREQLAAPAP